MPLFPFLNWYCKLHSLCAAPLYVPVKWSWSLTLSAPKGFLQIYSSFSLFWAMLILDNLCLFAGFSSSKLTAVLFSLFGYRFGMIFFVWICLSVRFHVAGKVILLILVKFGHFLTYGELCTVLECLFKLYFSLNVFPHSSHLWLLFWSLSLDTPDL